MLDRFFSRRRSGAKLDAESARTFQESLEALRPDAQAPPYVAPAFEELPDNVVSIIPFLGHAALRPEQQLRHVRLLEAPDSPEAKQQS